MGKKIIGLLTITAAVVTLAGFVACKEENSGNNNSQDGEQGNGSPIVQHDPLKYQLSADGSSYEIIGCYTTKTDPIAIEIPSTHEGKAVTAINSCAFMGKQYVTGITLPDSIVSVGEQAFLECVMLTSISIPQNVTSIGNGAFGKCSALEVMTVDPKNETYKSDGNCILSKDGRTLLYGCKKSVIPQGVTTIAENAFWGCGGLTEITFPSGLTSIEACAFMNCNDLTAVVLPEGLTSLGDNAFLECRSVKSIYIPDSLTELKVSSISFFSDLESITVGRSNPNYCSIDNCLLTKDQTKLLQGGKNSIIPDGVTTIGKGAFMGCGGLTSISIPNGVTTIEENVFMGCEGLTGISIPNSVTTMGEYVFSGCFGLTNITLSENLKKIERFAFDACRSLKNIEIPDNVTSISDYAFSGCDSLETVTIGSGMLSIGQMVFSSSKNLSDVSYNGTAANWAKVKIGIGNEYLTAVAIRYLK